MDKESNRGPGMPPEGSKVRLVGLKNPDLNEKIGHINNYSRGGERVMVAIDGQGLVKVKPKQVEVIEDPSGRGRPGLERKNSSRRNNRSLSRENGNGSLSGGNFRGSRQGERGGRGHHNGSVATEKELRVVPSSNSVRDNASQSSHTSQEIMETLRSADTMFDLADTSGDGVINQEEFEFYMKKYTSHDRKMIRECFRMIDVDQNGDITRDEARNAFLKKRRDLRGGSVSEKAKTYEEELLEVSRDADALFDKADFDKNGALSIKEFELYMKRNTQHSESAIRQLFHTMDADKNGFITREEVRTAYVERKTASGGKKSLMDILGLDDDDMADVEDDVYNMFFLADFWDNSFWFAVLVFVLKLGLIIIIAVDLFDTGVFPDRGEVSREVLVTQLLLLPVNVSVQEELITTFFIYANLKWSPQILELHPGATKGKFHVANIMRFLDGFAFLFINTVLLLQASQVLSAFLNFAALQFLSSIDNVALHLARDGYLTEGLERVAGDVLLMKLPKNHNDGVQILDSLLLAVVFFAQLAAWIWFQFVRE
mmetsp:Transcript_32762/g.68663  ORF Transcript_32762/g.68663 Transcript_32762/m.68663 type:complete len:542 (-) Transcript_32762:170-1795(-)|eukprot:CAMPEP_0196131888 /NCGR_PEP_ID=MMETSP0910-20130528/1704_1 /TAXON_ID=49265 /ORGANISM="Thalassiosira rotula, Strain GSO102" /LENGTH=541 /DNA_ID=CAMNT_0041391403 /DNA_START=312 /DNA_END=1937 /DNA_ORIENTATION=+